MKNIKTITKLRFLTDNVNGEFITDLTAHEGDKIGVKLVFEDDTEYLIAYNSMVNTAFTGSMVTHISHFTRYASTELWNSVDIELIDKDIFPNLNSQVINQELYFDVQTGIFYKSNDPFCFENDLTKELLNAEGESLDPKKYQQKRKANVVSYFTLVRFGVLGLGMENACFDDMTNRLQHLLI